MTKEVQLVKVVGTTTEGFDGGVPKTYVSRGILQLKRRKTLHALIDDFLKERGIVQYTLHERGDSIAMAPSMVLSGNPKLIITYTFTQFPLSEVGYYAKDLTREELLRDFKFLKNLLEQP